MSIRSDRSLWTLAFYPEAGEAGGSVRTSIPRGREYADGSVDPERSASEAVRRARGQIRRYCATNRLNRLATLTYKGEGCHDPSALRGDVAAFFRALRTGLRERFPYLWVPQLHPGGHGLHVHFAVGRFVNRTLIDECWGRGFVHIKLLGDLPVGSAALEEARLAARYISPVRQPHAGRRGDLAGLHRYEVAQGFQPQSIEVYGPTAAAAIANASKLMGREPAHIWLSSDMEGWQWAAGLLGSLAS